MTDPIGEQVVVPDYDRTARSVKGTDSEAVRTPEIDLRQGVVVAVNNTAGTVDVSLGGDTTVIPGVKHISNYRPTVSDTVQVIVKGGDLYVLDRLSNTGPSVISGAATAFVDDEQTRSSNSFGDLSTVGPAVTVTVSPSGRLLVQTSCQVVQDNVDTNDDTGGSMGFALSGANTRSPQLREASYWFFSGAFASISSANFSKVTLLTGLNPGSTTVTAKYVNTAVGTGQGRFSDRFIWVLPL